MIQFERLKGKEIELKDFFDKTATAFCDLSVGMKYMWRDYYQVEYAIINDTLIMKEDAPDYKNVFYYPIGKDVEGALELIEKHCREQNIPLNFGCIDNYTATLLAKRYYSVQISDDRDWSDYIYLAEKFKTYSGKKLSGQRNHVNKFKKLYPDYKFKKIEQADINRIKEFLSEYSVSKTLSDGAKEEYDRLSDYLDNMFKLGQDGGYIEVDGKIIAFSIGEVVADTLIVHVEKGLTAYQGVYPLMASEFVRAFATDKVKFVNREEDCGEQGLRTSKLQYQPLEIRQKNMVCVKTLFDNIKSPIFINIDGLEITDIQLLDSQKYFELYTDDELNKWWGYDYREDLGGQTPSPEYFYSFQQKLKDVKEEYALAVKKDGVMVGELVLHNFDYFGGVEMGFRFFKECQGKGYATISATALRNYCFNVLKATTVKSRCFKQNLPSARLISRIGLEKTSESDTHYFFKINKN